MDTDAGMRKLVELIFGKQPTIPEERAAHSYIPTSLLNEDFPKRLKDVLDFREYLFIDRWQDTLNSRIRKMLFSHISYVSYVMHYCLHENTCNENIFDSFISVCSLLTRISDEVFQQTQVDFSGLNPDIFMVFYRKALKRPFRKRKDFYQLVKYIGEHKYLKWLNDSSEERYGENLAQDLLSYRASEIAPRDKVSPLRVTGITLAREVLSTTSAELPDLPNESELIRRLVAYRKRKKENEAEGKRKAETTLTLETSHGKASLNSDSKTDFGKHQENIAWHESIIEAVIRHNNSKDSGKEIVNNQGKEEATGILEHLESKIKTLIKVLDDCEEK